jgi:hypothetical protein
VTECGISELGAHVRPSPIVAAVTEERRDRPSRGWLGDADSPAPPSGYPEWPPPGDATPDDAAPTDVYAALSDLAPYDAAPAEPAHGRPVPRDFAPPQSPWTTASDIGGSRVRLTPAPPPLDPAAPTDPATTYAQADSDAPARSTDFFARPGTEPQGRYGDSAAGAYGEPRGMSGQGGDPDGIYGRPPVAQAGDPTGRFGLPGGGYPSSGFSGDATDPGSDPAETYGRPPAGDAARFPGGAPDDTYVRPPAHSSDPTETFDRAWATRAGGSAGYDDPAANHHDRSPDGDPGGPAGNLGDQGPGYGARPDAGYGGPAAGYGDRGLGYDARPDAGSDGPPAGYGDQRSGYEARPDVGYGGPAAGYGDRGPGYDDGPIAGHGGPGAGYEGSPPERDERASAAAGGMYDGPPRVEWVTADETAVADGAVIDLSVPRGVPVNHRGRNRRRRGIVVAAALGAVLAGGAGYAGVRGLGLDGGTTHKNAEVPLVTVAPTTDPALPDDSPSIGIPDSASTSAARTTSVSPSVSATATTPATHPTTPGAPGDSGVVVIPTPTPTKTNSPHEVRPSAPASTAAAAALTARFSQGSNAQGIVGSVTVNNPGTASASWTVQVTVPGATQVLVTTAGVAGHLSGDVLTFSGPSIDAGDALTFSFVASGPLSGSASGCSVNGAACS